MMITLLKQITYQLLELVKLEVSWSGVKQKIGVQKAMLTKKVRDICGQQCYVL